MVDGTEHGTFDIVSSGPSMRAAKRHPHVGNNISRNPNRQK